MVKEWMKPAAIALTLALALLASLGSLAFWLGGSAKKAKEDAAGMAKFVASDAFKRLSPGERKTYLESLPKGPASLEGLNEAEKGKFMENARSTFMAEMDKSIKEYLALPDDKKDAWMDKFLAEHKMPGPPPPPPQDSKKADGSAQKPPQGPPPARMMKEMTEKTTPESRARFAEFMKAMRARAGSSMPGPPPPP